MPSLSVCNTMLFNNDASSFITGATGQNGTSKTSVASVSESSSLSVAPRGGSDVSIMLGGSGSGRDRVWMSSVPSTAKWTLPREYNELLAINRQLIKIIEQCDSRM